MNSQNAPAYVFATALSAVCLCLLVGTAEPGLCSLAPVASAIAKADASSCLEYWLNRYQTLLGVAVAIVAAVFAWMSASRQSYINNFPHYRQYIEELNVLKKQSQDASTELILQIIAARLNHGLQRVEGLHDNFEWDEERLRALDETLSKIDATFRGHVESLKPFMSLRYYNPQIASAFDVFLESSQEVHSALSSSNVLVMLARMESSRLNELVADIDRKINDAVFGFLKVAVSFFSAVQKEASSVANVIQRQSKAPFS